MKSIFRKIAFVLALVMVVTMFPVMNASAANNGNKYARNKNATLYVGGDANGDYESCWSAQAKTKTWMKEEGYKSSYESSDPAVATVSKYGFVEAVSVGKTTITATFSNGDDSIVEKFEVNVKKNAADVVLDKESQDAISALSEGDKVTLKAVMTDADGSNEDISDTVKFYCSSEADKEIINLDSKTGELTALKAGKATVVVQSCQWEYDRTTTKYKTTVTDEARYDVEVKAAGLIAGSAVQKDLFTFEVSAGTADLAKAIVDAYGAVTTDNARLFVERRISDKLTIKDLAIAKMVVKDGAPNVIVVTMAAQIEAASEYVAIYDGTEASFVGVEVKPASIEITTSEATFGVETPVGIVIKTVEGVDITASQAGKYWLETAESADYYLDTANRTILFWEEGKNATVTAVYDMGWDEQKGVKIDDLKDTKIIRSVKQAATAVNLIDGFAVTAGAKSDDDVKKLEFKQGVINLAVGDAYNLYAKYSTTTNKTEDAYLLESNAYDFTLTSSNENVLSVSGNVLYPQNAGSASVTVKRGNQTIGVAYINVAATRYLSTMDVEISKRNLSTADSDTIKVTVKGKDQLGGDITPSVTATTSSTGVDAVAVNNVVTLTANGTATQGTVTIKLTVSYGGVNRPYQFGISVKPINVATATVDGYAVTVSQGELDTKLNSGKHDTEIKIETLNGGFHLGTYSGPITAINSLGEIGRDGSGKYTDGMYIQVSKGSDYFKTSMVGATFQAVVSGTAVTASGSAINVAAPSGTYLVRVYQVKNQAAPTIVGSTTFTVKDSTALVADVRNTTVAAPVTAADASALTSLIQLKVDGAEVAWGAAKDGITYNLVGCTLSNTSAVDSYFVRTIIVEATRDGKTLRYEVAVNRLFKR